MPVVLAILAILWAGGKYKNTEGQVFVTESAYNYIEVLQVSGYTMLRLNEGQGVHSMYHPDVVSYQGPWMQFLAAPFFNQPPFYPEDVESMAIIGLDAGTTARQATIVFGDIPIEKVSFYCGSGVTAAHNALAVAHAGLGIPKIYAGSWSEWISDPSRPVTWDK